MVVIKATLLVVIKATLLYDLGDTGVNAKSIAVN